VLSETLLVGDASQIDYSRTRDIGVIADKNKTYGSMVQDSIAPENQED